MMAWNTTEGGPCFLRPVILFDIFWTNLQICFISFGQIFILRNTKKVPGLAHDAPNPDKMAKRCVKEVVLFLNLGGAGKFLPP